MDNSNSLTAESLVNLTTLLKTQNSKQDIMLSELREQTKRNSLENQEISDSLSDDGQIVKQLTSIFTALREQLNFERQAEASKQLVEQMQPKDYEDKTDTAERISSVNSAEGAQGNMSGGGLLKSISDAVMGGISVIMMQRFLPAILGVAALGGIIAVLTKIFNASEGILNSIKNIASDIISAMPDWMVPDAAKEFSQEQNKKRPMSEEQMFEQRKNPSPMKGNTKTEQAMNFFMEKGWSKEQAAGIVGNLQTESGNFAEDVISGKRKGDKGKAVGIAQWHPDRQKTFEKKFGKKLEGATYEEQLEFVDYELREGGELEKKAGNTLKGAKSAKQAAIIVDSLYERSSGKARQERIKNAEQLYKQDYSQKEEQSKEPSKMVDSSALRIKGGLEGQATKGGESQQGTMNLARSLQARENELPGGLNRFTAFNDEYHHKANPNSTHTKGLATDITIKDEKKSTEAAEYIKNHLLESGLSEKDFKIINEYKNPSKKSTGGHIHVNFANEKAAESYANYTNENDKTKLAENKPKTQEEKKESYAKVEKEIPEGKGYVEEESEMEETDEPILEERTNLNKPAATQEKEDKNIFQQMLDKLEELVSFSDSKEEPQKQPSTEQTATKESSPLMPTYKEQDVNQELSLEKIKTAQTYNTQNLATPLTTPPINIQPTIMPGMFGATPINAQPAIMPGITPFSQNQGGLNSSLTNIQQLLGGIGSAISTGQNMRNYGANGFGGTQSGIGMTQGILNGVGMQSPAIAGVSGALGNIGSIVNTATQIPNATRGGGILGGINAAQGIIGASQGIINGVGNAIGSAGGMLGGLFSSPNKIGKNLDSTPDSGKSSGFDWNMLNPFSSSSSSEVSTTPNKIGQSLGTTPYVSSLGAGSDSAAINSKYSQENTVSSMGTKLSELTKSVESTKQEMSIPPEQSPVVVQGGGKGGSGPGGGGNTQATNPPGSGTMGIDVGVRNQEATLLKAQYGAIRVV